jgi:hypothetical protein
MKIAYKIITGILIFTALGFTTYQLNQEDQLIVGTWVSEDDTSVQLVFTSDGLQKDIINGILLETYTWQITESQTPGGLIISHLILTNTEDPNDTYHYEINALSEERLVLVYQRPGGGIGKLTTYYKQ